MLSTLIKEKREKIRADENAERDYVDGIITYLSLCIGRMADRHSKQTIWDPIPRDTLQRLEIHLTDKLFP